jgi:hypothetical protein
MGCKRSDKHSYRQKGNTNPTDSCREAYPVSLFEPSATNATIYRQVLCYEDQKCLKTNQPSTVYSSAQVH